MEQCGARCFDSSARVSLAVCRSVAQILHPPELTPPLSTLVEWEVGSWFIFVEFQASCCSVDGWKGTKAELGTDSAVSSPLEPC